MIGKYHMYDKKDDVKEEDLDAMGVEELLDYFENWKGIRNYRRTNRGECENCDSPWYIWRTNSTLDATYWFCTDCYYVKHKAPTG